MKSIQIILAVILISTLGACAAKGGQSTETDGVFKGVWFNSEEPLNENIDPYFMYINIDLYAKTIEERGGGEMTHGGFYVNNGFFEQGGDITSARLEGNKAYIEYIDPAALTYSATLTYIPETRQLKFEDGDIIKKGGEEEEMILSGNLYVQYHRAIPPELILDALLPHPRSARKGLGIYGNVSKVTEDNGNVIEFDEIGNILKEVSNNGKYTKTYEYVVPYKKYMVDGFGYNIIYGDHERKDMAEHEFDTEGSVEYYFDDQDRIIKLVKHQRMIFLEHTFNYIGESKLPKSMKVEDYDEYGNYTTITVYEYPEIDEQGNWLKREVTQTQETTTYEGDNNDKEVTETHTDPPYIETRIIEYF